MSVSRCKRTWRLCASQEASAGSGDEGGWCGWLVRLGHFLRTLPVLFLPRVSGLSLACVHDDDHLLLLSNCVDLSAGTYIYGLKTERLEIFAHAHTCADLVPQLLHKFDSGNTSQVHENVSAALVWILSQHGQMQWVSTPTVRRAPLAKRMLEPEMVSALLEKCLADRSCASAVECCISVIVELAKVAAKELDSSLNATAFPKTPDRDGGKPDSPGNADDARNSRCDWAVGPDTALGRILEGLEDLIDLLHNPPPMPRIVNSTGTLDPPLGVVRLKVGALSLRVPVPIAVFMCGWARACACMRAQMSLSWCIHRLQMHTLWCGVMLVYEAGIVRA